MRYFSYEISVQMYKWYIKVQAPFDLQYVVIKCFTCM